MHVEAYLFRTTPVLFLVWVLIAVAWTVGGWLVVTHVFRLERRERLIIGFGVGMVSYIVLVNLLARLGSATFAFVGAAVVVLLAGIAIGWRAEGQIIDWKDISVWPLLVSGLGLALLFARVNAGLGIFDDPHHLGTIALMALGDIPPHFFLNSDILFRYHYGFDLLGASLVHVGGMYPWSAYDIAKGIVWSYFILVAYLLGRRYIKNEYGGLLLASVALFAGGTRYLLVLLPASIMDRIDQVVQLIGTSAAIGEPLSGALLQPWPIDGGPPVPFPFAFQNGIFRTMGTDYGGTGSLGTAIMVLIWLLAVRARGRASIGVLLVLLSGWALCTETSYGVFMIGVFISVSLFRITRRPISREFRALLWAGIISVPVVLLQGGTITSVAADLLQGLANGKPSITQVAGSAWGFGLRWPPAILSGHLGSLHLSNPIHLLVALFEMGPAILFAPWIVKRIWIERGEDAGLLNTFSMGAIVSFIIPVFITYSSTYTSDRDMVRFTGAALFVWVLLLTVAGARDYATKGIGFKAAYLISLGTMILGGVVLTGIGFSAIEQRMLSPGIEAMDAQVSADAWNVVPKESLIFDSFTWRATVLTGGSTRADSRDAPVPEWSQLVESPTVEELMRYGYEFVYIDVIWWEGLSTESRESLSSECVNVISEKDNGTGIFRRLIDLRGCDVEASMGQDATVEMYEGLLAAAP